VSFSSKGNHFSLHFVLNCNSHIQIGLQHCSEGRGVTIQWEVEAGVLGGG